MTNSTPRAGGTHTEVVLQLPDGGGDLNLRQWCRAHNWAVTTEADCYGYPPKPDDETQYALYDADEDDPPVALFSFKEDALAVAMILTEYSAIDPALTPEQNPPEFADDPPPSMVYLNGSRTSFRCRCGANVFTTGEIAGTLACNGCGAEYEGTA